MNVSRMVGFATAAVILSVVQWAVFLMATANTQSVRAVSIGAADEASAGSMRVVVIRAHHQS